MKMTVVLFGAVLCLLAGSAAAEDYVLGTLAIGQPWARATPRGAAVAGGYLTITNKGPAADRLMGGSTVVANRFELHSMAIEDGVARMRPVEGGVEIKPRQTVELQPGGFHIMLVGLKQPLQQGERVKGTLLFEKAGKVDVEFTVVAIGATVGPAGAGHGSH
jgi:periplasmic copper chaperone A